jgi:hypothetical protein
MERVTDLLKRIDIYWSKPKKAVHREVETVFNLTCSLNAGADRDRLASYEEVFPDELLEFYRISDGGVFFRDVDFGQWGLNIHSINEVYAETELYFNDRGRDASDGDLIIGQFIGDSDLLMLRCDPNEIDYGRIMVVLPIDSRKEWEVVAKDFYEFLYNYYVFQGDKFWEIKNRLDI